jgi:hypothetical protein
MTLEPMTVDLETSNQKEEMDRRKAAWMVAAQADV